MTNCGVILAGGKSTRMGQDKAFLPLQGEPIIHHIVDQFETMFQNVIIVANDNKAFEFLNIPVVPDRYQDMGPLAGIESAMNAMSCDQYILAACDMPFIKPSVYRYLLQQTANFDAVIPEFLGHLHPLSGIYKRSTHEVIQKQLKKDDCKIRHMFDSLSVNYVDTFASIPNDVLAKHFFNMNNPEQYNWARHV